MTFFRTRLEKIGLGKNLNLAKFFPELESQALTWSEDCVISSVTGATKFKITDKKNYVPIVTLSTQNNEKLLQ